MKRLKSVARREPRLRFHEAAGDRELAALYASARAVVFPTIAEGCGLPLLEALWRGVPCVCSDLPVLRENAEGGGCVVARVNDLGDWREKLGVLLSDRELDLRLRREATSRALPTGATSAGSWDRPGRR